MKYDNLYLRKRPNYDEMIDNIVYENPKLKYPNRLATLFRNSPYGSQFDGDNSFINLEEQENNIMKERIILETLKQMSSNQGLTHTATQARYAASERSSYPPPSNYEDFDDAVSDFTGMADEELERRELEKRAKYAAMAERVNKDLEEHIKATAKGLVDYETESVTSEPKQIFEEIYQHLRSVDPLSNIKHPRKVMSKGEEQASSSTSKPVYPTAINPTTLPVRTRSTSRKGTKREGDEPEGAPRRIRSNSQPPIKSILEKKKPGRPPDTEEVKQAKAEAKAKLKAQAKAK